MDRAAAPGAPFRWSPRASRLTAARKDRANCAAPAVHARISVLFTRRTARCSGPSSCTTRERAHRAASRVQVPVLMAITAEATMGVLGSYLGDVHTTILRQHAEIQRRASRP
jgi:hypothetical protein